MVFLFLHEDLLSYFFLIVKGRLKKYFTKDKNFFVKILMKIFNSFHCKRFIFTEDMKLFKNSFILKKAKKQQIINVIYIIYVS